MRLTSEEIPISTRLSGTQEPPNDQSTSWPNPKKDKDKVKMHEYEDSDGNESAHSLDNEYGGLNVPITSTPATKKEFTKTSEKPLRSTRKKNVVIQFVYNAYISYHYAFMIKVATVQEPEKVYEATKDPRWVEAMNEEMQALSKTRQGISSPLDTTKRQLDAGGYSK